MVVVCITRLEKAWNKGKAEIFEQEDLDQVFFMDIKKLLFLENKLCSIITTVIQTHSVWCLRLTKVIQSTVRIVKNI
jgi:hypothetical protein